MSEPDLKALITKRINTFADSEISSSDFDIFRSLKNHLKYSNCILADFCKSKKNCKTDYLSSNP